VVAVTVHLIIPPVVAPPHLWPTFARLEAALGGAPDAAEKALAAERPADGLGGAQACERLGFRRGGEQIGKPGKARADRLKRSEPIVFADGGVGLVSQLSAPSP
jgi:hypothetical protein